MSILRRMLLFVSPLLGLARPLSAPFDRGGSVSRVVLHPSSVGAIQAALGVWG